MLNQLIWLHFQSHLCKKKQWHWHTPTWGKFCRRLWNHAKIIGMALHPILHHRMPIHCKSTQRWVCLRAMNYPHKDVSGHGGMRGSVHEKYNGKKRGEKGNTFLVPTSSRPVLLKLTNHSDQQPRITQDEQAHLLWCRKSYNSEWLTDWCALLWSGDLQLYEFCIQTHDALYKHQYFIFCAQHSGPVWLCFKAMHTVTSIVQDVSSYSRNLPCSKSMQPHHLALQRHQNIKYNMNMRMSLCLKGAPQWLEKVLKI